MDRTWADQPARAKQQSPDQSSALKTQELTRLLSPCVAKFVPFVPMVCPYSHLTDYRPSEESPIAIGPGREFTGGVEGVSVERGIDSQQRALLRAPTRICGSLILYGSRALGESFTGFLGGCVCRFAKTLKPRRLRRRIQERKYASSHPGRELRRTTAHRCRNEKLRWSHRVHPLGKRPDKTTRGPGLLLDSFVATCSLLVRAVYTRQMPRAPGEFARTRV